jgi:hypothetical protein
MFRYDDALKLTNVETHLSNDRLAHYLAATNNDLAAAIKLYIWNTEISAAFHLPLQALEVGLRNALHGELCKLYCPTWFDHNSFLALDADQKEPRLAIKIDDAKKKLQHFRKPVDPPHVVAALDFGFWTYLVSRHLEPKLWSPALHRAFPTYTTLTGLPLKRSTIAGQLDFAREFRNRISHYEPIFYRDLQKDYESILKVCSWMFTDVCEWIEHHCAVRTLLASKPAPPAAAVAAGEVPESG